MSYSNASKSATDQIFSISIQDLLSKKFEKEFPRNFENSEHDEIAKVICVMMGKNKPDN